MRNFVRTGLLGQLHRKEIDVIGRLSPQNDNAAMTYIVAVEQRVVVALPVSTGTDFTNAFGGFWQVGTAIAK